MKLQFVAMLCLAILIIAENTRSAAKKQRKQKDILRDLGWKEAKNVYTIVNETNQLKFGLPIGTKLKVDRKTKLHKPPPLSDTFTADDRIRLMWNNELTKNSFCKVTPGNLTDALFTYDFYWYSWCRNSDGENLCCNNYICECNAFGNNCDCLMRGL